MVSSRRGTPRRGTRERAPRIRDSALPVCPTSATGTLPLPQTIDPGTHCMLRGEVTARVARTYLVVGGAHTRDADAEGVAALGLALGGREARMRAVDACEEREARPCPLCGAGSDERYGPIGLGDGWLEAVYRRDATRDDDQEDDHDEDHDHDHHVADHLGPPRCAIRAAA